MDFVYLPHFNVLYCRTSMPIYVLMISAEVIHYINLRVWNGYLTTIIVIMANKTAGAGYLFFHLCIGCTQYRPLWCHQTSNEVYRKLWVLKQFSFLKYKMSLLKVF